MFECIGSAFVSSSLQFSQEIQPNIIQNQRQQSAQNNYKSSGSRWERNDDRGNRRDDRIRNRDARRYDENSVREDYVETPRNRHDRDEFGRDVRRDRERDRDRDRERERDRDREKVRERERPNRRSESPTSTTSSQITSRVPRRRYEPVNVPKLAILKYAVIVAIILKYYIIKCKFFL